MVKSKLTSPKEDLIRWGVAIILPLIGILLLLVTIPLNRSQKIVCKPPQIELSYVNIPPKKKAKPKAPPKQKQKKVVKKVTPQKKRTVHKKVQKVENIQKSKESETPADLSVSSKKESKKSTPKPQEPQFYTIRSTDELDNSSYTPIYNPKPEYPTICRRRGITGFVDVELTINSKGKIIHSKIVKSFGHPLFGDAVLKVIGKWRFPPPRKSGKKINIIYRYRVNFRLNQ